MLSVTMVLAAALLQGTERVSVTSTGAEIQYYSTFGGMSPDGRFLTFCTQGNGVVPGDQDDLFDFFLVDRHLGTVRSVSFTPTGSTTAPGLYFSQHSDVSADGRFVAFGSRKDNLVPGDTNQESDVFVRDLLTGAIERVSVGSGGIEADGPSFDPRISADGRIVFFHSRAPNLLPPGSSPESLFVHDRVTLQTRCVYLDSAGTPVTGNFVDGCDLSADGRFVTYSSSRSDHVAGDTNGTPDVFIHDLLTGANERVSLTDTGLESFGGYTSGTAVCADGSVVAFLGTNPDLITGVTTAGRHIFVRDRRAASTELVSVDNAGLPWHSQSNWSCAISPNGESAVFVAHNALPNGSPNTFALDPHVHDRVTGWTELTAVPYPAAGSAFPGESIGPTAVSADGRFVAFQSSHDNLIPADTNQTRDVFVRDRGAAAASGVGTILLTADYGLVPGQPATLRWFCAPPNAGFVIAAARSDAGGQSVLGHPVDLVPPYRVVAMGNTGAGRHGAVQSPPVPPLLPGTEIFFEMLAVDAAGTIHDSNPVARPVL